MQTPPAPPSLPTELWAQCVDALDQYQVTGSTKPWETYNNKDFKSLSLTSSLLRALAQPLVFKNISLGIFRTNSRERVDGLKSLFSAYPESSSWTRYLRITGWDPIDDLDLLAPTSELVVKMDKLQAICIRGSWLNAAMYRHICQLPGPLHVECSNARVDDSDGIDFSEIQAPSILKLGLYAGEDLDHASRLTVGHLILSPQLISLSLSEHVLPSINQHLRSHPSSSFALHSLLKLTIPSPTTQNLEAFLYVLARCPNLMGIWLGYGQRVEDTWETGVEYELPATTVPLLRRFYGTMHHAKIFIPGRPVETAEVWMHRDHIQSEESLQPLARGNVLITDLRLQYIVWSDNLSILLRNMFPGLKRLTMQLSWYPVCTRPMMLRMGAVIENNPGLEGLHMWQEHDFPHREMIWKAQRKILDGWTKKGFKLVDVSFQKRSFWRLDQDGEWTRIPKGEIPWLMDIVAGRLSTEEM